MNKLVYALPTIIVTIAFTGCSPVGPDYLPPELTDPDYSNVLAEADTTQQADTSISQDELVAWWQSFGDGKLENLIGLALVDSPDMAQARARIVEAGALLGISEAGLAPRIDASGNYSRNQSSENVVGAGPASDSRDFYGIAFDAAWEIDIFGGVRRSIQAAQANLESEQENLNAVWVSLAADVASTYIELRTLQERLDVALQNLRIQQDTLELVQSRYDAGLTDNLAVQQARYNLEQTRSIIPALQSNIEAAMNALCVLTGQVPGEFNGDLIEAEPIPAPKLQMVTAIPADTLRIRPDVRRAERALAAQTARIGVAAAELYPRFTLGGSIGLESLQSSTLFESDSSVFGVGPAFSWPIFTAGAIRNNIKAQTAVGEQFVAVYENTVLNAVREVRNVLMAFHKEHQRYESLARAAQAARQAVDVAEDQYKNGLSDFNNVLLAQNALLSLEENLVISQGNISSSIVALYRALGGGWQSMRQWEQEMAAQTGQ